MVEDLQRGTGLATALRDTGSGMILTRATSALVGAVGPVVTLLASMHLIPFCSEVLRPTQAIRGPDPS